MAFFCSQFMALLCKCFILRKRHYITSVFEFLWPFVLPLLLIWLLSTIEINGGKKLEGRSNIHRLEGTVFNKTTALHKFDDKNMNGHYLFTPNNAFTQKWTQEMVRVVQSANPGKVLKMTFTGFDNEKAMVVKWLSLGSDESDLKACFVFTDGSEAGAFFKYKIRVPDFVSVNKFPLKMSAAPNYRQSKYLSPYKQVTFAHLQVMANEALLNLKGSTTRPKTETLETRRYPFPYYKKAEGHGIGLAVVVPILLWVSFFLSFVMIVKRLADEKVNRAREMFKMMGLSDWVYWGSTFTNYFIVHVIHSIVMTALFFIDFGGLTPVISKVSPIVIFLVILVFGMAFICLAMLFSIPFNRPVIGVIAAIFFWFVHYQALEQWLKINEDTDPDKAVTLRTLSCLVPLMGMYWSYAIVSQADINSIPISVGSLFDSVSYFGYLSLGVVLLLMLFSCVLYGILIWYLDAVWPFQAGLPKPVYFPFLPSYWCRRQDKSQTSTKKTTSSNSLKYFEPESSSAKISVKTVGVKKYYGIGSSRVYAVRGVSLDVVDGQVTVLLGHNGAGKSTLMHMMTGIFPPSEGSIFINGYNIVSQTTEARRSLSLCPQHDILYDELTIEEHLIMYGKIKGYPSSQLRQELKHIIEQIQLTSKAKTKSSNLSGGMKRKLSLGIALFGETKVVILDEPTSGLDPEARRAIWDLLLSIRRERTILLTTHFMEEADALGDRIAIMSLGEVKCCGTPMFLKKVFGTGYQLRVAKSSSGTFRGDKMDHLVTTTFPKGSKESEVGSEVIYSLESETNKTDTSKLPHFFDVLEKSKIDLGIESFGLSVTTMEDVFLKVGHLSEAPESPKSPSQSSLKHRSKSNEQLQRLKGISLTVSRFNGLFIKRFHYIKRSYWALVLQLVVPCLVFIYLWSLEGKTEASSANTQIDLNAKSMYGSTKGFYQTGAIGKGLEKFRDSYISTSAESSVSVTQLESNINPNEYMIPISNDLGLDAYKRAYLVGAQCSAIYVGSPRSYQVWYNHESVHSLPIAINLLYESILREMLGSATATLNLVNHQLPSQDDVVFGIKRASSNAKLWNLFSGFAILFLGAAYVLFVTHERVTKAKLIQLMTGLSSVVYWLANFLFDMIVLLFCVFVILIIFVLMDTNGVFMGRFPTAFSLFLLLLFFGAAAILLAYVASYFFSSPATAFTVMMCFYLLSGVIGMIALSIVKNYRTKETTWPDYMIWVLRLSPVFSASYGISKLYETNSLAAACDKIPADYLTAKCNENVVGLVFGCCKALCEPLGMCFVFKDPLTWSDTGIFEELFALVLVFILCILFLCLAAFGINRLFSSSKMDTSSNPSSPAEDSDVTVERTRISRMVGGSQGLTRDALVVNNLYKAFDKFVAVNRLTFGIHQDECFGLLGINGAGKTTTFRMLTGDLIPDKGNANIASDDLIRDPKAFQQHLGYCPQFDALLDKLTGVEILYLFGRLRGIQGQDMKKAVNDLIVMVDLQEHAKKMSETYSGGNKRKLSLAIALMGSPDILLLDEPTTGVDPGARRKIWGTLGMYQKQRHCSLILTSHSMDECEALCSRVAIMVNGEFMCFGSIQHLRSKFAQGFTLILKLKREVIATDVNYVANVKAYVNENLRSPVLRDYHETVIHYQITDTSLGWAYVFGVMEKAKVYFNFEDYIVSDTNLEQIFIAFARTQTQAKAKK